MDPNAHDAGGRRKYLTKAEGRRFLEAVDGLHPGRAAFCLVIYYTGCRISEALNLRGTDIDAEDGAVVIRTLKRRGRPACRRIPVPEALLSGLADLSPDGGRLWSFSRTTGWRIVRRVMEDAGISGIHATARGMRHAFGVRGAMGEVPVTIIQEWMGHSDLSTTSIYLRVRGEEERKLIAKTW